MELRKISLRQLVQEVHEGKVVLPDFKGDFVWGPRDVEKFLASVLRGDDIGKIFVLEYDKDNPQYETKLIDGVKEVYEKASAPLPEVTPEKILLDGHQRVAALYYALYKPSILLKDRRRPYTFYLDMEKALDERWDEAVFGISIGETTMDVGKYREKVEGKEMVMEFRLFRDFNEFLNYFVEKREYEDLLKIIEIYSNFNSYEINMVYLPKHVKIKISQ